MAFTITCDDVSSGYPLEYLQEIRSLLDSYHVKATFFVIPYHGEWDLLTESPQFVQELHELTEEGHEIGLHGYAHYQNEFGCQPEKQTTVKNRFIKHISPATYWLSGYFEKGYLMYTGVMLQVKTRYELGLFDRISRLSASAYFLKVLDDWLFILAYVVDVKIIIKYFNTLMEQDRIEDFSYMICYDYLPRRE